MLRSIPEIPLVLGSNAVSKWANGWHNSAQSGNTQLQITFLEQIRPASDVRSYLLWNLEPELILTRKVMNKLKRKEGIIW